MTDAAPEATKQPATDPPTVPEPTKEPEDKSPSVFSGWGFDVNSVANNIAIPNFFANNDLDDPKEPDTEQPDIGSKAVHLAEAATVELGHASKAAQKTIGKAAQELGKGWGTFNSFLDDMLASKPHAADDENADMKTIFRTNFPELNPEDELVDHFKCVMLQKYRCYLNNVTPEKAFPMRGVLFVTTTNLAMYVIDDGGAFGGDPFGVSMTFKEIGKIQKGANAMLRIVTNDQQSFIFGQFESDTHFAGALSLLEHMTAAGNAPATAKKEGDAQNTSSKEEQKSEDG